jgi:hypothetical protein
MLLAAFSAKITVEKASAPHACIIIKVVLNVIGKPS